MKKDHTPLHHQYQHRTGPWGHVQTRESHSAEDSTRSLLREAVFGVQDGLVSTMGALTGIAAATQNGPAVVIAGLVVISVESLSMAAGSYMSSRSQRQYLERILAEEAEEIINDPDKERQEIVEMYKARGYTDAEVVIIANRLMSDPKLLLEDMAHKELGISPDVMEEPLSNAVVMGLSYIIGGLVPIIPYWLLPLGTAMPVSIVGTLIALFIFGGLKGRMVRQGWWQSGLEMLMIAGVASLVGFFIGRLGSAWVR